MTRSFRTITIVLLVPTLAIVVVAFAPLAPPSKTFSTQSIHHRFTTNGVLPHSKREKRNHLPLNLSRNAANNNIEGDGWNDLVKTMEHWTFHAVAAVALTVSVMVSPAFAENELSDRYGSGLDTSLVDQTCLLNHCSLQAKACLQDDPDCRKGLTCTAKCLGDNACITGCMARYGDSNLDSLLKCTIEDHDCIKVAILPGGSDAFGSEPRAPAPTIPNFNVQSMEGSWYKVAGYNPNYDCYACQRNTFAPTTTTQGSTLEMDVEFSMPHLLPDGSPPPPSGVRESFHLVSNDGGLQSMALNDYHTHEVMVFDSPASSSNFYNPLQQLVLNPGTSNEASYARTAHSEGEMFGLKFWENWYVIGENDKDMPEFKFIYYNGKTRQNTYEGAFVYSRTKELSPESMKKVYQIALEAGMDPKQFCRIQNGCFADDASLLRKDNTGLGSPSNPFRGILASTRVSQLLGVEPVAARDLLRRNTPTASVLTPEPPMASSETLMVASTRKWWHELGDYLENPHRHFEAMEKLRQPIVWPEDVLKASR